MRHRIFLLLIILLFPIISSAQTFDTPVGKGYYFRYFDGDRDKLFTDKDTYFIFSPNFAVLKDNEGFIMCVRISKNVAEVAINKEFNLYFKLSDGTNIEMPYIPEYEPQVKSFYTGHCTRYTTYCFYRINDIKTIEKNRIIKIRFFYNNEAHDYSIDDDFQEEFKKKISESAKIASKDFLRVSANKDNQTIGF